MRRAGAGQRLAEAFPALRRRRLAGATQLELERREVRECHPGGPVATVDKTQTIHQVVTRGKEPAVSLHVYSQPIDSCVAYDLARGVCYRREMTYHSEHGQVILRPGDPTPPAATPTAGTRVE